MCNEAQDFWSFLGLTKQERWKLYLPSSYPWIHYCFLEKIGTKISSVFYEIKRNSSSIDFVFSVLGIINEFLYAWSLLDNKFYLQYVIQTMYKEP